MRRWDCCVCNFIVWMVKYEDHVYKYDNSFTSNTNTKWKEKHLSQHHMYLCTQRKYSYISEPNLISKKLFSKSQSLSQYIYILKYVNSHLNHCASSMCASAPVKMNEILEGFPAATSQPWCLTYCMLSSLISSPSRHCPILQPPACLARQTDYTSSSSNHIWYIKSGSRNWDPAALLDLWQFTCWPLLLSVDEMQLFFPYDSMLSRIISY